MTFSPEGLGPEIGNQVVINPKAPRLSQEKVQEYQSKVAEKNIAHDFDILDRAYLAAIQVDLKEGETVEDVMKNILEDAGDDYLIDENVIDVFMAVKEVETKEDNSSEKVA